jgi:hypothetical protein
MSILKKYVETKEYIVTVFKKEDLDSIYDELETLGKAPSNTELTRSVRCVERRPSSRNTVYKLTDWEAAQLRNDPRVQSITVSPKYLGIRAGEFAVTQTSTQWNKSFTKNVNMLNWGLLRCFQGQQTSGWGSDNTTNTSGTITLTQTGKNVDIIIVDGDGIVFDHPEYALNSNGTGGSRAFPYNWFEHQTEVGGFGGANYSYGISTHATHVAGTAAGNTQGWARDANIYNIYYLAGDTNNYNFPYVFDYVREFHRTKPINQVTGRKNPTICNNSWGMSIFPQEWSYNDITAVTYRGTRYTAPEAPPVFIGESGVYAPDALLSNFATTTLENCTQRIENFGEYNASSGNVSAPPSWTISADYYAYLEITEAPSSEYVCTIQGPAALEVLDAVEIYSDSGNCSLTIIVEIYDSSNNLLNTFTDGPYTGETYVAGYINPPFISLPNNEIYTVKYKTEFDVQSADNPTFAVYMSMFGLGNFASSGATVSNLTFSPIDSVSSLTSSTTPTVGNNDDGYWEVSLPFTVNYLGTIYDKIYVGTNFYFTFGGGSTTYSAISPSNPPFSKIMVCSDDNSMQRIYYGATGITPNREFRIVVEGNNYYSGVLGSPGMRMELTFYENDPRIVDLTIEQNNKKGTSTAGFSNAQLISWGLIEGQRIPVRVDPMDADLEDAYSEGIIMVGAAGNGQWKHDVPGGLDWNNTFEMAFRYPESVNQPYYYMRGTSPTANDTISHPQGIRELPAISVGAVDVISNESKATFSDCGPGVDIYAPGRAILSSYPSSDTFDPRGTVGQSHYMEKLSGTSMASPQVCGVLACALEIYPHWNQYQAKEYITKISKSSQLLISNGGPGDSRDLQGSPNRYLYYKQERVLNGNTYPKINYNARPTTGAVYPRTRIRKTL